jgi:hypothetical protein
VFGLSAALLDRAKYWTRVYGLCTNTKILRILGISFGRDGRSCLFSSEEYWCDVSIKEGRRFSRADGRG